jgi:hypothetical protein
MDYTRFLFNFHNKQGTTSNPKYNHYSWRELFHVHKCFPKTQIFFRFLIISFTTDWWTGKYNKKLELVFTRTPTRWRNFRIEEILVCVHRSLTGRLGLVRKLHYTVHCKQLYLLHTIIALLLTGVLRNILDFLFFVKTYTIHEQFLDLIDFLIFVKMYPIHEQFWFKLKELKQAWQLLFMNGFFC